MCDIVGQFLALVDIDAEGVDDRTNFLELILDQVEVALAAVEAGTGLRAVFDDRKRTAGDPAVVDLVVAGAVFDAAFLDVGTGNCLAHRQAFRCVA